jgi:hypothetical protein
MNFGSLRSSALIATLALTFPRSLRPPIREQSRI